MRRRGSNTFGIILILLGGWFLAVELLPEFRQWLNQYFDWPVIVIGVGLIFIVAAVTSRESGLAVPGSIISGIGGILYYQNATNDWESWAYAWTLIIGFVGIGTFIMHMLDGRVKRAFSEGFNSIVSSAVMFLIFGSFFRFIFGQEPFFGEYWPLLLIGAGAWMLIKPMLRTRPKTKPKVKVEVEVNTKEDKKEDEDEVVKEEK